MRSIVACLSMALCITRALAQPQTFSSTSTGADGALTYAANLGTVYFPPAGLAPRPNNIYNFTTITIGAGTTVRVSGWVFNSAVYWLAQGDVTINGVLDLSGQPGHPPNNPSARAPSEPGVGGYSGGVAHAGTGQNATAGSGPGGGAAPGSNQNSLDGGGGGAYSGSNYLQPLIGGSGGGGGCRSTTSTSLNCGGGGAGAGAILIASSTQIVINAGGNINASGGAGVGNGNYGGGGSGGAVRLVSNTIQIGFTNTFSLGGGPGGGGVAGPGGFPGGSGILRLEAFNITGLAYLPSGTTTFTSTPYNLALPVGGPSTVSVSSVNGTAINANPFSFPDTRITTSSAVPVVISGTNVPSGTTGNLYVFSENGPDQVFPFTLTGTLQSTTATVNVPYPSGGSRGFAKATWTSQ